MTVTVADLVPVTCNHSIVLKDVVDFAQHVLCLFTSVDEGVVSMSTLLTRLALHVVPLVVVVAKEGVTEVLILPLVEENAGAIFCFFWLIGVSVFVVLVHVQLFDLGELLVGGHILLFAVLVVLLLSLCPVELFHVDVLAF